MAPRFHFCVTRALADDFTPVSAVTADALIRLDPAGDKFDSVAQLMPNCPLRTAHDVSDSYRQFQKTGARIPDFSCPIWLAESLVGHASR